MSYLAGAMAGRTVPGVCMRVCVCVCVCVCERERERKRERVCMVAVMVEVLPGMQS